MPLDLEDKPFVNPAPPPNYRPSDSARSSDSGQPLTNADFRKLLMTPAASGSVRKESAHSDITKYKPKKLNSEALEKRREKKLYYASLVKEAKEREDELAQKYRDRAKERRETQKGDAPEDFISTTANFKAVAPNITNEDNAETRRRIIDESKFLGGDLEHTHLVKGLDYALLQKVKAELESHPNELEEENEEIEADEEDEEENKLPVVQKIPVKPVQSIKEVPVAPKEEPENACKSKLAKNLLRVISKPPLPKVNELFLSRRMAYVMDLDDEETDIPITLIRSKAECPNQEISSTVSTNDIVINKLVQILSYLRQSGKKDSKKMKKKKTDEIEEKEKKVEHTPHVDIGIYDDIGDYVPDKKSGDSTKNKSDEAANKRGYFDFRKQDEKEEVVTEVAPTTETAFAFIKNINQKYADKTVKHAEKKSTGMEVKFDPDSYSECYPGTRAEEDVNIDSDEEPDFDKMDMGNKKGAVGRWDFDSQEEYSSYMGNKEATPKAAFQFGVKTNDGRKTRRVGFDSKAEKTRLDKEWTQISKIIDKRKIGDNGGAGYKKPKY